MTVPQSRLLPSDAFAWHMEERDPTLRSTVVSVIKLDRPPDWPKLRTRFDRVSRHVPRLRQCVRTPSWPLGSLRWQTDDSFDLDFHLVRERVAAPGTWDEVLAFARRAAMEDFDRARPLWRTTVLDGLADGSSAVVTKIHHSLTDGIGGMQISRLLVDPGPEATPPVIMPHPPRYEGRGVARSARKALATASAVVDHGRQVVRGAPKLTRAVTVHPVAALQRATSVTGSVARFVAPIGNRHSEVLHERRTTRLLGTIDVPLAGLSAAAHAAGGHVNDAFLAAVVDALYRYHDERHALLPEIRITVPVSVRRPGDSLGGNRITLARITLPAGDEQIAQRIVSIAEVLRSWRKEPALAHTQQIAFGLNLLPRAYLTGVFKRIEAVASDVPGLREPVWLAGARVTGYYPFGPTIGAAVNVTLMSYAGTCNVGVNIDTHAVDDPAELLRCLRAGFDAVLAEQPVLEPAGPTNY
jgi:diacylglycerol O-acyltransferase